MPPGPAEIEPEVHTADGKLLALEAIGKLAEERVRFFPRHLVLNGDMRLPALLVLRVQIGLKPGFEPGMEQMKFRAIDPKSDTSTEMSHSADISHHWPCIRRGFDEALQQIGLLFTWQTMKHRQMCRQQISVWRKMQFPQRVEWFQVPRFDAGGQDERNICFQRVSLRQAHHKETYSPAVRSPVGSRSVTFFRFERFVSRLPPACVRRGQVSKGKAMNEDWKSELQLKLDDLIDQHVVAGLRQEEVLDAVAEALDALRKAHAEDPDPAEDDRVALDEPANDWPAAS